MNSYALGWDNHRKFSKVSLMEQTPDGEIRAVERARLEHDDPQAMRAWLAHLDPQIPVALEATFGWPWVADLLEALGHPVHLAHPPVVRALAKHEAKTDRCDSARTSPVTLWSAAGRPSARPARNWAVRCRIPNLCRAGRLAVGKEKLPAASGCPNTEG